MPRTYKLKKRKKKLCAKCNKPIFNRFKHAKYCLECYKTVNKEYMKRYLKKKKNEKKNN